MVGGAVLGWIKGHIGRLGSWRSSSLVFKVLNYLDEQNTWDSNRKQKKLPKPFRDDPENVLNAVEYLYFNEFLKTYYYKEELLNFITSFTPDFDNIYILQKFLCYLFWGL